MIAHRVIQQLREGKFRADQNFAKSGQERASLLADEIALADKFYFENIPLEPVGRDIYDKSQFGMPPLTQTEREMWVAGLLPLPATKCWFEFIMGHTPAGALITRITDCEFMFTRVDFTDNQVSWAPVSVMLQADAAFILAETNVKYSLTGYTLYPELVVSDVAFGVFIIYLCLMLLSRTTEITRNEPSKLANKIARDHGKTPRFSHTIVNITPKRFRIAADGKSEPTDRHVRLHSRRSHIRHYDKPTPLGKFMSICACCQRPNQWIVPIAQYWVGKRELGEITHDYRVST